MRKFTDAGYGVIIGEYGVCHNTDGGKHVMKRAPTSSYGLLMIFQAKWATAQ